MEWTAGQLWQKKNERFLFCFHIPLHSVWTHCKHTKRSKYRHTESDTALYKYATHRSSSKSVYIQKIIFLLLIIRQTQNLHCRAIKEFCLSCWFGGVCFCSFNGLMYHKIVVARKSYPRPKESKINSLIKAILTTHFFV